MRWTDFDGDGWRDAPRYVPVAADTDARLEALDSGHVVRDGDRFLYSDVVVDVVA